MRSKQTRASDATFDLNLAPVLDIIVSIVPMLLLSVAFVQVKMIEAPTPQMVTQENFKEDPNKKHETTVSLRVSKTKGFDFEISEDGKSRTMSVGLSGQAQFDLDGLLNSAMQVKKSHPEVTKLSLIPDGNISFNELVAIMDKIRMLPRAQAEKLTISEAAIAKPVENTLLFPEIVFASVGGGL